MVKTSFFRRPFSVSDQAFGKLASAFSNGATRRPISSMICGRLSPNPASGIRHYDTLFDFVVCLNQNLTFRRGKRNLAALEHSGQSRAFGLIQSLENIRNITRQSGYNRLIRQIHFFGCLLIVQAVMHQHIGQIGKLLARHRQLHPHRMVASSRYAVVADIDRLHRALPPHRRRVQNIGQSYQQVDFDFSVTQGNVCNKRLLRLFVLETQHIAAEHVDFGMRVQIGKLFFKTLGQANIVRIHAGNVFHIHKTQHIHSKLRSTAVSLIMLEMIHPKPFVRRRVTLQNRT
ncbi:MAG: hypothetical protein Q4D82_00720, partial [Neisseria sp.]|nr:hypothetical protein [Neisseria sp.]